MEIKECWMSRDTREKSRYGLRTPGGILGIALLALALICGGTALGFSRGWPMRTLSVLLCLGVTALVLTLALRLGRRSAEDATVFFLTEEDRLFAMDGRRLVDHGGSALSQTAAAMELQAFLRQMARRPYVPAGADEILRVEHIRENRSHAALVCRVRHPNGMVVARTYLLAGDMARRELLLRQLERRQGNGEGPEVPDDRRRLWLALSVLVCCGCGVACVLSHPAVAQLPQRAYFPCLAGAFGALCCAVWFGVRGRRGA